MDGSGICSLIFLAVLMVAELVSIVNEDCLQHGGIIKTYICPARVWSHCTKVLYVLVVKDREDTHTLPVHGGRSLGWPQSPSPSPPPPQSPQSSPSVTPPVSPPACSAASSPSSSPSARLRLKRPATWLGPGLRSHCGLGLGEGPGEGSGEDSGRG